MQTIDAVTAEDVARVGSRLLNPDKLRLAVVGPNEGEKELQGLLKFQ